MVYELPEKLAAEQPVLVQLFVSALEHRDVWDARRLAVPGAQLQATEQLGPEIGRVRFSPVDNAVLGLVADESA